LKSKLLSAPLDALDLKTLPGDGGAVAHCLEADIGAGIRGGFLSAHAIKQVGFVIALEAKAGWGPIEKDGDDTLAVAAAVSHALSGGRCR